MTRANLFGEQNMGKKEKPSTPSEVDSVESSKTASQPSLSLARDSLELNLSEGQRQTMLKYVELPTHLSKRFAVKGTAAMVTQFTLDELDELLDLVGESVYRAKGNERQKVLRIGEKLSKLLGSTIDPDEMAKHRVPTRTDTVFQIKITLKGIAPPIWRRIQTMDCTLDELHALIQVTMGWESMHLYRFIIGGVEYADLDMTSDDEFEDASGTMLSEVLPSRNLRPRLQYEYDFGDGWIHQLIVEERFSPETGVEYPICIAGQRACPPEDCGGPWSYAGFVEAIHNADHRRHKETLEWVGSDFDSERLDLEAVNNELRQMKTKSELSMNKNWLNEFQEKVANCWQFHSPALKIGFSYIKPEQEDNCWEIWAYPPVQEIVGGKEDGETVWSGFYFDVLAFLPTSSRKPSPFALVYSTIPLN